MANNTGWIRQLIEMLLRLLTSSKSSGTSGSAGGTSRPQGGAGSAKLKPQPHKKPKKPSGGTTSSAAGSKSPSRGGDDISVGQLGDTRTIEIAPPAKGKLTISYDPSTDNDPDAGEIIWVINGPFNLTSASSGVGDEGSAEVALASDGIWTEAEPS